VLPGDTFTGVRGVARVGDPLYLDDRIALDLSPPGGGPITVQPELVVNMSSVIQAGDTRTYHSLVDLGNTVRLQAAELRDA